MDEERRPGERPGGDGRPYQWFPEDHPAERPFGDNPPIQPPTNPNDNQQLYEQIRNLFFNPRPPAQFNYGGQQVQVPQYQPGANPFQMPQQGGQAPNAYQPGMVNHQFQQQQGPQVGWQRPVPWAPNLGGFNADQQAIAGPQPGQLQNFNRGGGAVQGPNTNIRPGDYGQFGWAHYAAQAAPRAREVGQFNPQQNNQIDEGLQSQILNSLGQPSRYDSSVVQNSFNAMNQRLGQEFDLQRQGINEDAARRGVYFSTGAVGRLGDVATRQAQAQSDLATNLLREQANTYGQDRNAAVAQALGYGGQQFGNQLAGYQANMAGTAQNFQQQLSEAAFRGDQQAMQVLQAVNNRDYAANLHNQAFQQQLQAGQFGQSEQQRQYQNAFQNADFNRGNQQINFGQQLAGGQFGQSEQARMFGQNFAQAGFNRDTQQGNFNNLLQQFQAGQGADQQRFNQQLQAGQFGQDEQSRRFAELMGTMGFNNAAGQQGFENRMGQANMQNQFNQDLWQQQLQAGQFNQGLAQQNWANQMGQAQFQQGEDQRQWGNRANEFGMNEGAQQNAFGNRMAGLQALLGYGQQQFQNQMDIGYFNQSQDQNQLGWLMQLMGMT